MTLFSDSKKQVLRALIVGLCAVVSVGCEKGETPEPPIVSSDTQLHISTEIQGESKAVGSRSSDFTVGDSFGLYVVANRASGTSGGVLENDGNFRDNVKFSASGASPFKWSTAVDEEVFYPTVKSDLYAFAPYGSTFEPTTTPDKYKLKVAMDQSSTTKIYNNDFLTARNNDLSPEATPVPIKFYHRLAKLDIVFRMPKTYQGRAIESINSVKVNGAYQEAVIDLKSKYTYLWNTTTKVYVATGGTYPVPASANATLDKVNFTPNQVIAGMPGTDAESGKDTHYELLLPPQTIASYATTNLAFIEVIVNYGGGGTERFAYQVPSEGLKLEAGMSNKLTITFSGDQLVVLGVVDILAWGSIVSSGSVTERVVYNKFTLSMNSQTSAEVHSVKLLTSVGDGDLAEKNEYTLKIAVPSTSNQQVFAFDGLVPSPDFYPYSITGVELYNEAGDKFQTVTLTTPKLVTAMGDITLSPN